MTITPVRETLRGSHLLLTGVTGFLGKVWLGMVLDFVPEIDRITVLVRARKGQTAKDRFMRIAEVSPAFRPLRKRYGSELPAFLERKVEVIEGDVSAPMCGIEGADLDRIAPSLDAVVHFAGLTDFEPDPRLALATNVEGARNAADVAAQTRDGRLLHVSTTFVAGNVSGSVPETLVRGLSPAGKRFDPEREVAELRRLCDSHPERRARIDAVNDRLLALGWPNIYTYSKALAEHLLAGRSDVHVTTVRPAVVECAQSYPFLGWNEGINTSGPLVWLLGSFFRRLPSRPDHRFDVIPVDTVARTLTAILAAALRNEAEEIYQLGSSAANPLTFGRAIELTGLAVRQQKGKAEATPIDRFLVRYLDAIPRDADDDPFPSMKRLRKTAQGARDLLRRVEVREVLPPRLYAKVGANLEDRIRSTSMQCRNADRVFGRVEDMLRLYRPFIHDNDYIFVTANAQTLSEGLSAEEQSLFGFDIAALDWRHYWLKVQVPGLYQWSLPLIYGERVADDPAPPWATHAPTNGARTLPPPQPESPSHSLPQPLPHPTDQERFSNLESTVRA